MKRLALLLPLAIGLAACAHKAATVAPPTPPAAAPAAAPASPPAATAPASASAVVAAMPEGAGKQLTATTCSGCHTLDRVVRLHQSREKWQGIISEMKDNGLDASDADLKTILDYLSKNYGPPQAQP